MRREDDIVLICVYAYIVQYKRNRETRCLLWVKNRSSDSKKVVFQICHEKKLFYSIQFKETTFYSSIRLTFWRSKDKFYVTWFLTCMSLLSLFEWLSRFICLGIYVWIWKYQAFTLSVFIPITYTTMPKFIILQKFFR